MIHDELDVLRHVTVCQPWLQEDPCQRKVFMFATSNQEFELKCRSQQPDELNRHPQAEPPWEWPLDAKPDAASPSDFRASHAASPLVSLHAPNQLHSTQLHYLLHGLSSKSD